MRACCHRQERRKVRLEKIIVAGVARTALSTLLLYEGIEQRVRLEINANLLRYRNTVPLYYFTTARQEGLENNFGWISIQPYRTIALLPYCNSATLHYCSADWKNASTRSQFAPTALPLYCTTALLHDCTTDTIARKKVGLDNNLDAKSNRPHSTIALMC